MKLNIHGWYRREAALKLTKAVCPYLETGRCTIYKKRFSCCRNYGVSCQQACATACASCSSNCCEGIIVPEGRVVTRAFIRRWMAIDCTLCRQLF